MTKGRALALIALSASSATTPWARADDDASGKNNNNQCRIYLAPSASAGPLHPLGVYSGVSIANGEAIGNPEIGIPFIDATLHSPTGLETDRIFWMASESLSYEDRDQENGLALAPGIGFAGANNPLIAQGGRPTNAEWDKRWVLDRFKRASRTGILDARRDPGAGANSEYFDLMMKATASIGPGEEILPAIWPDNEPTQKVSDRESREKAQQVLEQFVELTKKHDEYFTPEKRSDVWDLLMNDVVTNEVKSLLPASAEDARSLAESGASIVEGGTAAGSNNRGVRSLDWLKENGQCMDNLYPGPSTVSAAGRGAFAKRPIPKGGLVAPGPLLRVSRDSMDMFRIDADGTRTDEVVGRQLMINYCFGHRDSSVMLFPLGSTTNFINHDGRSPNVEVRWSRARSHQAYMLDMSVEELNDQDIFGLMFDFVATRDIAEGEEVFMDYGREWETAWKEHTASWTSTAGGDPTASALNEENAIIRTLEEQKDAPYPGTVSTHCSTYHHTDFMGDEEYNAHDMDTSALETGGEGGAAKIQIREWTKVSRGSEEPCDVIGREMYGEDGKNKPLYVVRMNSSGVYLKNVPHRAITFRDEAYTSPMHRGGAFRHEISIPDDIFPESWKDQKGEGE